MYSTTRENKLVIMNMWQLTQEISNRKQATGKCDHEGSPQNASSPSGPESSSQIVRAYTK